MYIDDFLYFPASVFLLLYINAMYLDRCCLYSVQRAFLCCAHALTDLMEELTQDIEYTPDLKACYLSVYLCSEGTYGQQQWADRSKLCVYLFKAV
jgi:hypothetical protein